MDRNTLTGLVLIGLILVVFSLFNQNKEDEGVDENSTKVTKKENNISSKESKKNKQISDTLSDNSIGDENQGDNSTTSAKTIKKPKLKGKIITKETNKLIISFNTKGGYISSVKLKDYKTYQDFVDNKKSPLVLFENGDHQNYLKFKYKGKIIRSTDSIWRIKESKNAVLFTLPIDNGEIVQSYKLKSDKFDLDYSIEVNNINEIRNDDLEFIWSSDFLKTERLLSEQRRVSTVYYNEDDEGVDYLSESTYDWEKPKNVLWVAYKQSYFSSILKPSNPFVNTKLIIDPYDEGTEKDNTHIKEYYSELGLELKNGKIDFNWYFGPNDFEILESYNENYDEILNLGWGLFRWINIYAVQPIFKWIVESGVSAGISILLLTIILKILLMPVQWKMFVSSIKMRILRPEIDKLNKKFPNKEDAMKKQMEMMSLYRDTGASPLAGCIPMLIQMPILFAVFRFFPASFDLRQEGFLWAEDLSSYDSILDFSFNIPLYGDHISLFTLLMAGTTLMYTFMNSGNMQQPTQPGMPNMKVIMYIFPIMMIFFFNNYSSGLSYYYFLSTLLSIVIMLAIKYWIVDEDKLRLKMANRQEKAKGTPKKKSKWQQRLEEMQKKQQEMLKNRKR